MVDKFNMTVEENVFCAKRLLVDSVYSESNLEGIAITYAQTCDILNNVSVSHLTPVEVNKVCCLRDGWKYTLDTIHKPFNLGFLDNIHKAVARFDVDYKYLGVFRKEDVLISGTKWRPELPNLEQMCEELRKIGCIENATERALVSGLYVMRVQPFKDGNRLVGSFVINKLLISEGKGIFKVPVELNGLFKQKLVQYYETNNVAELVEWCYDNCLFGTNNVSSVDNVTRIMKDIDDLMKKTI